MTTTTSPTISLHWRDISPSPLNQLVRGEIDDDAGDIKELAASIAQEGLIQPLTVTETPAGYQIVTGERRWRAARLLGDDAPLLLCVVKEPMDELDQLLIMGTENLQRKDMTPIAEAKFYQALQDRGLGVPQIARKTGKTTTHIYGCLALLDLAEPVQTLIDTGAVNKGAGKVLADLPADQQVEVANKMRGRKTNEIARVVAIVKNRTNGKPASNGSAAQEERLRKQDELTTLKKLLARSILQIRHDGELFDRCADALSICEPDLAGEIFDRARQIERSMTRFQDGLDANRQERKEKKRRGKRRRRSH